MSDFIARAFDRFNVIGIARTFSDFITEHFSQCLRRFGKHPGHCAERE
jgi:hypothetical protein